MKAIKTTLENKHLLHTEVGVIVAFGKLPTFWLQDEVSDGLAQGFGELTQPDKTVYQKYGEILEIEPQVFVYAVEDFSASEIEAYDLEQGRKLRAHEIEPSFNTRTNYISGVANELDKEFNEFTGVKEKTTYVNDADETVAVKNFNFYNENGKKGTIVTIDFYDKNNTISETTVVKDFYSEQRIEDFKSKCANRVLDRMLFDVKKEIDEMNFFLNNASQEQVDGMLAQFGIPSKQYLQGMLQALEIMFNDLFKDILLPEVLILRNSGNSEDLYNALSTVVYAGFDEVALTSPLGLTYRQISLNKFNPENFNFYE